MKRGFIFTLLVLVIIVFMITELSIYFRTYELRQESEPNKIRSQVINEVASQFADWKMAKTAGVPLYSALYALNNDTANGAPSPLESSLAEVVWNLSWNGTRIDTGEEGKIAPDSTLSKWDVEIKQMVASMNIELNTSYHNISIGQADPWTVQFNFTVGFNMSDPVSKVKVSANNPVSVNISIRGFEDPYLSRTFTTVEKNILPSSTNPSAEITLSGEMGRGWFYGQPVRVLDADDVNYSSGSKRFIMVTDDVTLATTYSNVYGAVVLVSNNIVSTSSLPTIDVPILINQSININSVPTTPFLIASDSDELMTDSGGSDNYHLMYNIESVRNMVQCGEYVAHASGGYSYLSRLTGNLVSDEMGIETTIAGLGSWTQPQFQRSSVDHNYLAGSTGSKIMGLPGCSDKVSCGLPSSISSVNPTRLDGSHAASFGMTALVCPDTVNRCG